MFQLTNLTISPRQAATAVLADGTSVFLTFIYRPAIQRWTVDVSYPTLGFTANGLGLATHPNLLRLWRNLLPFGLQITTIDGTDPFLASDLDDSAGTARVTVNMLDSTAGQTDVQNVETQVFAAGAPAAF